MLPTLLLLWEAKEGVWPGEEKQPLEGTRVEETGVESQFPGTLASLLTQNSNFLVLRALIFGVSGQV